MKHIVYVIKNSEGKLYKGYTTDLNKRIQYHNQELGSWTRHRGPWQLVYQESCNDKSEALKREKFLKSGKGREFLKEKLRGIAQPG
ncbi:MAG TPA: hypothetical protein DDW49_08015 [Deltaproteobacteria bacterium]|nr:hypothetical protein [Deltaproteobacteria bacterium]